MTEDPVRLLSQKGDAFAASLLESAREGDRDTARSHKALVLGAASGAVLGGAAIASAAKLSPGGLFSMLGGKWLVAMIVTVGGLGVGAALLWPRDAQQSPPSEARPSLQAPSDNAQAASAPADTPAQVPVPAAARDANAAPASPESTGTAAATSSTGAAATSSTAAAVAGAEPAAVAGTEPAAEASARAKLAPGAPSLDAKSAGAPASASVTSATSAAPATGAAPGLAEEVAALRAAHEALGRGQSQRCLDAVNAYFAAFPSGHLSAEARYLRVEAMFAGGQRAQAAALARTILAANPKSPYAARLRVIAGEP